MVLPLMPILGAVASTYLVTTEFIKPSGAVTETDKEVVSRLRTVVGKVNSIETKLDELAVGEGNNAHSATYGEVLTKLGEVNSKLTTNKERYDRVLTKLSRVDEGLYKRLEQMEKYTNLSLFDMFTNFANGMVSLTLDPNAPKLSKEDKKRMYEQHQKRVLMMKQRRDEMSKVIDDFQDRIREQRGKTLTQVVPSTRTATQTTTPTQDPRTAMVDKFLKEFGLTRELIGKGPTPNAELGRMATEINRLEAKLRESRYAKPKTQADTTTSLNYSYRLLGVKVAHRYITDGYRWDTNK